MTYSFQTFVYSATLTSAQMNQVEANARDHVHGLSGVSTLVSSMVPFTQAGSGAIARTLYAKLQESISIKDFGAVGDGVIDDTAAIQAAFNQAVVLNEAGAAVTVLFPPTSAAYIVSASINITAANLYISSSGIARIQPLNLAGNYPIFNITSVAGRVTIENITFYMFGSSCTGIAAASIWRQATIRNCFFIGGDTGLDLAGGSADRWGITIAKCRFQDCTYGIRWILNGQTGSVVDCLFFNCLDYGLVATTGSQLLVQGSVFESSGDTRGRAVYLNNVDAQFISCQSETLYYDGDATGISGDYAFQLVDCKVHITSCRWWGGSWGSAAPGNSRQYGIYLNNTVLIVEASKIYSFRDKAFYAEGATTSIIFCDLASQVDYRISGNVLIQNTAALGRNHVVDGAFERFRNSGSDILPFSWQIPFGGAPAKETTNLMGLYSVAGLGITDANQYQTNDILVEANERIAVRFFLRIDVGPGIRCAIVNSDTSVVLSYILGGDINISGGLNKEGLISGTYLIPSANVKRIKLVFSLVSPTAYARIEEVALYKITTRITTGAIYSDNDSTFGFVGPFGPLLAYCSGDTRVHNAAPLEDTWTVGDRVKQRVPAVGQPKAWMCTVAGTPGTWVSEGNL